MKAPPEAIEALVQLGFTELEARIYLGLLRHSPATGYKVAKEIGATNASTYKALESLESKGAVLVDEAENRLCRAVPWEELLDQMERGFEERRRRAARQLRRLRNATEDDRIYQLKTVEQVYARCQAMLRATEAILTVDIFPLPLARLRPEIEQAAARGARTLVQVYEPAELQGAEMILRPRGAQVLARWPVQWIALASDGREVLLAAIAPDESLVHQALWTASPVLSYALLAYADSEMQLNSLTTALGDLQTIDELKNKLASWQGLQSLSEVPGYRILRERFAGPNTEPESDQPDR